MTGQGAERLRGLALTDVLDRARAADSPATLLRALTRADVVLPYRGKGPVAPPVLALPEGPTALAYTSYARLEQDAGGDDRPWQQVSFAALAARWPADLWLRMDGRATLSPEDVATVAELAAGRWTWASVSVGECDRWVLWPGASLPDAVDLAVVAAAAQERGVLQVLRAHRQVDEPAARPWRVVALMVDAAVNAAALRAAVAGAAAEASPEVVELRVVDLTGETIRGVDVLLDDEAVVLWRRASPPAPDVGAGDVGLSSARADPQLAR